MKLIALAALSAITLLSGATKDIAQDEAFEVDQPTGDALIAEGSAKVDPGPSPAATTKAKSVQARLLIDSEHGKCNDVVNLPPEVVKELESQKAADSNKAAVAYALTLDQNKKKAV